MSANEVFQVVAILGEARLSLLSFWYDACVAYAGWIEW
jgi:hypothetical protein